MKWIIVFLVLLLSTTTGRSQVATIKDEDGYTNVRVEPHANAQVIGKIREYDLFIYETDADQKLPEWVKVFIPKNKYSVDCKDSSPLIGFIHSSRLLPLEKLEKYSGSDFVFHYNLQPFSPENKIIEYSDTWITAIQGRRYYGTDGTLPGNEITSIDVMVKGRKVIVPAVLYEDLFQCNNQFTIYKHKDVYYAVHWNSDGAGGYLVAWAVDAESVRQRLILVP